MLCIYNALKKQNGYCSFNMALIKSCNLSVLLVLSLIVVASSANSYGYDMYPKSEILMNDAIEFLPTVFSVQGIIYCKSGSKLSPLKGAVVRITCLGIDKSGYEMEPFSIYTRPTDSNGYFLAKLSTKEDDDCKISQCKAFLHSSSFQTCQVATDTNKGSSGASLYVYRHIGSNKMRLYSLGPFVYTSEERLTPTVLWRLYEELGIRKLKDDKTSQKGTKHEFPTFKW